jgi:hypothetical protein
MVWQVVEVGSFVPQGSRLPVQERNDENCLLSYVALTLRIDEWVNFFSAGSLLRFFFYPDDGGELLV